MKNLVKLKKNFVINTDFVEKSSFNEPVYIIDSDKNSVLVYTVNNRKIVTTKQIEIDDKINTKSFITIKEFFKRCTKDDTEYKIEKVNNGDIYIRVAYFGELSLFFKMSKTNSFILTNINNYKFQKTNNTARDIFNNLKFSYYQIERTVSYLKNLKNIKRDFLYYLNNNLSYIKKSYEIGLKDKKQL